MNSKRKIAVGLSGGVDSAVTAALLLRAGHQVCGVTMQFWTGNVKFRSNGSSACFGPREAEDIEAARAVADFLGIPHKVIPLAGEYESKVLNYYRGEYLAGRTPNPCVVCNALIKFGALWEALERSGAACDLLAMGHYARVEHDAASGIFRLRQGIDQSKDQSYFLHRLNQQQLSRIILPLGEKLKRDVICEAKKIKLPRVTERKESQDFIESDDHASLFEGRPVRAGKIMDTEGNQIGSHRGLVHYTIGQRDGLGVCGSQRMYVKEIRSDSNTIVIGKRNELLLSEMSLTGTHWIGRKPPGQEFNGLVRLRYRHPGVQTRVTLQEDNRARAVFSEPQFAVTPGQAAVFYRGDEVLGGGWIA
jgi:tRNA-specific 2-thiouridylase